MVFKIKIPIFVYFKIKETMGLNTKFFDNIENKKFYILKCLKTDKEFIVSDARIPNEISEHIKNVLGITIPTNFEKKKFLLRTGKNWYYQFFHDPIPYSLPEHITCKICNTWKSFDLNNKSGAYTNHVLNHGETLESYLSKYPEESKYFNKHNLNKIREEEFNKDENFIECLECGKKFKTLSNTHMKHKHNMTLDEYKEKHNVYKIVSKKTSDTISKTAKQGNENVIFKKVSKIEKEFVNFLDDNGILYKSNDRELFKGGEIDILLVDYKIGFEFNGLFYHSENSGKKNSVYHLNKSKSANQKGYHIYHIYEDSTTFFKDIVFKKILHELRRKYKKRIKINKFYVSDLNSEIKDFLNKNSLDVKKNKINKYLVIKHESEILSIITLKMLSGKIYVNDVIENLTEFKVIEDYSLIFESICEEFKSNEIIFNGDRGWINIFDNIYINSGFVKDSFIKPSYGYLNFRVKRNTILNKYKYSIEKLKKMNLYIEGLSEWECMQRHGFDRIWDCGLIRYVYKRKEVE